MDEPKQKLPFYKRPIVWVPALLIACFVISAVFDHDTRQQPPQSPSTAQTQTQSAAPSAPEPVDEFPDATMGEKNALKSARSYLRHSNFSYDGLIGQLEFEKYSTAEATFAADNCGADWDDQAAGQALGYLSHSNFSYSGLIEQLEFEGFTHEQAVYGADSCGADWNEQAAGKAASYLRYSSFSRDQLIEQLEFEGFSYEQAVYGAAQNGY